MGIVTNINSSKKSSSNFNSSRSQNSNGGNSYKNTSVNYNTYNNNNYTYNYSSNNQTRQVTNFNTSQNTNNDTKRWDNYNKHLNSANSAAKSLQTNYNFSNTNYSSSSNYNVAKINYSNLEQKYMDEQNFNKIKPELMNLVGAKNPDAFNSLADIVGLAYRNKKRKESMNYEKEKISFGSCIVDTCTGYLNKAKKTVKGLKKPVKKVGATGLGICTSLVEGISKFGESLVDTSALAGTGIISLVTAPIDLARGTDFTDYMYENTKKFISKNHVGNFFDFYYDETGLGSWINDVAYGFDTVRSISSSLGYTTGVILTAIGTGGTSLAADSLTMAAPTASTLGMSAFAGGVGKGAETAYQNDASTEEGAAAALATGTWEGFQFYIGGKIAGLSPFESELANVGLRVGLDTIDGASEGFVQPLISTIYQKGYYDPETKKYIEFDDDTKFFEKYKNIWNEQGGWKQVGTQAAVGLIMSSLGESTNLRKAYANRNKIQANTLGNINDKLGYFQSKNDIVSYERVSVEHMSRESQQALISDINGYIRSGNNPLIRCKNTMDITSYVLENVDDLSKVKVEILGGLGDSNGRMKAKYLSDPKYTSRVTYNGYEALEIMKRIEGLEARIDKNLPTIRRARQIYELVAEEFPVYGNEKPHYIGASLRGITSHNVAGHEGLVCAGYSQLYKELCDRANVPCEYVRGIGKNMYGDQERHAWNMVIGDRGERIPVDTTWKVGGEEFFGPSDDFMKYHIADMDEEYRIYSPALQGVDNLDFIVETMDAKYGKNKGIQGLIGYIATDDPNRITSTNGARKELQRMPKSYVISYIDSLDRKVRINESINYIQKELEYKYGLEQAMLQLNDFLSSGKTDLITRSGGARMIAESLTADDLKLYNSGGTY